MSVARRLPLWSGRSWANRRPSSRSSMWTAASCSRCSSAATRPARCAVTSCSASRRLPRRSRPHARRSPIFALSVREVVMQRTMLDLVIRWGGAAGVAALPGAAHAAADAALLPRNLSPWNMFVNADIVVQAVMVGLAFASLVTWTIWLAKTIEVRRKTTIARKRLGLLEADTVLSAVEQASRGGDDAVAQIIQSAARE